MSDPLRLACMDSDAPPLFLLADPVHGRRGYEPAVGELIAAELGRPLEWVYMPWSEMLPSAQRHEVDGVLCGQGIIPERLELVDFTRPYTVFHESVLMRRGEAVAGGDELGGKRVAAISGSANMNLARTFAGAELLGFDGGSDDVFGEMLAALRAGMVDAVVDDDVVFVPIGETSDEFELAFTVETHNPWGIGVAKDRPQTVAELNAAIDAVIADGRHREVWRAWLPTLAYPFEDEVRG